MSSEEDSAGEGQLSFAARAKAKRTTSSRLPRVDAGEPRAAAVAPPSANGTSLDLRSPPPPLRNGFMSGDEQLEAGERGAHLLRDILQGRRGDEEEEDDEDGADASAQDEDDDEEMAAAADGSARASDDETDAKRARVENIVSNMRRGGSDAPVSAPAPAVNGCKKRKLYQPQQALSADDELRLRGRVDRDSFRQDLLRLKTEVATMQRRYDEMQSEDEDGAASDDSATAGQLNNNDDDCRELTTPPSELSTDAPRSSPLRDVKPPVVRGDVNPSASPPETPPDEFHRSRLPETPRQTCIVRPPPAVVYPQDMERLVNAIKAEISCVIPRLIDNVWWRFARQPSEVLAAAAAAAAAASHPPAPTTVARRLDGAPPCRDDQRSMLTQMLDRKSPRTKVLDRNRMNGHRGSPGSSERPFYPSASTPLKSRHTPPFSEPVLPEQTEAMSLVVPTKKKRHKVTDTRLVGREPGSPSKESPGGGGGAGFPPPPLVPVSLPTSVAIPNPSLHHAADVFYHVDQPRLYEEQGAPLPLMLAAAAHSPAEAPPHRYPSLAAPRAPPPPQDNDSDNSQEYDSSMAMMSFLKYFNGAGGPSSHGPASAGLPGGPGSQGANHTGSRGDNSSVASDSPGFKSLSGGGGGGGGGGGYTSTLTPMHLRKAKLMFFYVRYPSSAILKMYFPDINFNKNNTAQLVKWFSNFREFYYIQMEKYARQSVSEGIKNVEELTVSTDSELLRVLNLHYNRNNHIEVPENFRYVVEQTLREFFRAIVAGKDQEQSWKKAIYKVIARLDDNVPEYFKSPNFLEQLE